MTHALQSSRRRQESTAPGASQVGSGGETDLASAPGGGNQAALAAMMEDSPECALDDPSCVYDAELDEILGDGGSVWILGLCDAISERTLRGLTVFAQVGLPCDAYLEHFDRASCLGGLLHDAAVRLLESARYDARSDEVSWDAAREERVYELADRAELAVQVLDALLLLADQDRLVALAEAITAWSQTGFEALATFQIRARTGEAMLFRLGTEFRKHQRGMEEALAASSKDVGSLLLGPLTQIAGVSENYKRFWSLANAFETIGTEPEGWYDTLKAMKSVGFTAVGEVTRTLAEDNPFRKAWTPISVLVDTCQMVIDLADAASEVASMKHLLDLAVGVRDEYGKEMALYAAAEPTILASLAVLQRLSGASERVDAAMAEAEVLVARVGDPTSFYGGG